MSDENRFYGENQSRDVLAESGGCCLIRKSSLKKGYLDIGLKDVREVNSLNVLKMYVLGIQNGKCKAQQWDLAWWIPAEHQ